MDNLNMRKQAVLTAIAALRGERTNLLAQLSEKTAALADTAKAVGAVRALPEAVWLLLPASLREAFAYCRRSA